jgi:PHP family Zn ribbon phosphoesterase
VNKINNDLLKWGRIDYDGRPIFGKSSQELVQLVRNVSKDCEVIPAHAWTPWFSIFGSMSGFDAIEDCFEELTENIFALETGLSSDPAMNWRLSALDRFILVSNSDAHSAKNLGREANIFDCKLDYIQMMNALKNPGKGYLGTIEFFQRKANIILMGTANAKSVSLRRN